MSTHSDMIAAHSVAIAADGGTAPEWVHLLPMGRFQGRDGRGPYVLRDQAHARQVIAASQARAEGMRIPLDYDHQLYRVHVEKNGGKAPAAGHIETLEVRPDGIWGKVTWTPAAQARIQGLEYRYLSPVFHHDAGGAVSVLWHASLTALPNLPLTALNSQQIGAEMTPALLLQLAAAFGLPETTPEAAVVAHAQTLAARDKAHANQVASLAKTFKLGDGATPDQVALAAQQVVAGIPDLTQYVTMSQYNLVAAELAGLKKGEVERAVSAAIEARKIQPALKDEFTAIAAQDLGRFKAMVEKMVPLVSSETQLPPGSPPADKGAALTTEQLAICSQLGLTAEDYRKSLGG